MTKKSNNAVPDVAIGKNDCEGGNAAPHDEGFSIEQLEASIGGSAKFEEIKYDISMGIMWKWFNFPDDITEQIILLLKQLSRDDALAVRCCVERLVRTRSAWIRYFDADTAEVMVPRYDAMLAALVPWLEQNGMSYKIKWWPL
jgi:hypothetical protein